MPIRPLRAPQAACQIFGFCQYWSPALVAQKIFFQTLIFRNQWKKMVHFWILAIFESKNTGPWSPKKNFFFQILIFDPKRIFYVFCSIKFGKMPLMKMGVCCREHMLNKFAQHTFMWFMKSTKTIIVINSLTAFYNVVESCKWNRCIEID